MAPTPAKSEPAETASAPEAAPTARPSPFVFIGAMLILTGLGVGAGGLVGLQISSKVETTATATHAPGPAAKGHHGPAANLRTLPPIVTNLASPGKTWIRLEAAVIAEGESNADANVLTAQVTEDIVAFMRTVSLGQIEGASGFQHLREDLSDRVRIRSGGKFTDLIIQSMLIE
jgi:flagellar FliL protein